MRDRDREMGARGLVGNRGMRRGSEMGVGRVT
jgi:hypothetical protein